VADGSESSDLEIAKAALTAARDSVAKQQTDIRDYGTAAAALLTGSSVVVALLGGRALDEHRFPVLVAVGLALFLVSLGLILVILVSQGAGLVGLQEVVNGSALLEQQFDGNAPAADALGRLAATYDRVYTENVKPKRRLGLFLVAAAVALVLQILCWGLTIVLAQRASPAVAAQPPAACVPARIHGIPTCLARGQLCDRRYAAQYARRGFACTLPPGHRPARLV
jgi:hypothetical protein